MIPETAKGIEVSRTDLTDDFDCSADDGLGPVVFSCRALTGPERRAGTRHPRLSYYGMIWFGSALLAIYLAGGCLWLLGFWPPQPQDRPIIWACYITCIVVLAWVYHRLESSDKLVVHERGFQYRINMYYHGRIHYANVREMEIGRGLDFDRLGVLRFLMKSDIVRAGRTVSANSAIVKMHNGKLKVMFGVLSRFAVDDLERWLEAVARNCPDRVRITAT
jgi:hypothetical protein